MDKIPYLIKNQWVPGLNIDHCETANCLENVYQAWLEKMEMAYCEPELLIDQLLSWIVEEELDVTNRDVRLLNHLRIMYEYVTLWHQKWEKIFKAEQNLIRLIEVQPDYGDW